MRESISRRVVGIAASLLVGAPAAALACPVCGFVGTSSNTWAYQAMTAVLSLLPLAMIGATVWWLARVAARAGTERPSATERVVDHAPLGGIENALSWREQTTVGRLDGSLGHPSASRAPRGASAGVEVAFDSLVQGTSPTRRGPRPVGSSVTAVG